MNKMPHKSVFLFSEPLPNLCRRLWICFAKYSSAARYHTRRLPEGRWIKRLLVIYDIINCHKGTKNFLIAQIDLMVLLFRSCPAIPLPFRYHPITIWMMTITSQYIPLTKRYIIELKNRFSHKNAPQKKPCGVCHRAGMRNYIFSNIKCLITRSQYQLQYDPLLLASKRL